MANEPISTADFLNHIRATLDSELQPWEFVEPAILEMRIGWRSMSVRFLGTGDEVAIAHNHILGEWRTSGSEAKAERVLNLLNGLVRDDSGRMVAQ